jgi:hypothetical protein
MKKVTRDEAIDAIRGKLLTLVDSEHSMCEVASRLGIFCRGFSQHTTGELRKRYDWIVKNQPWLKREEVEDLANRWQLARQFVLGTPIACDTQAEDHEHHHACMGWREFTDEKLASFHRDLLGEEIEVVASLPGSRAADPAAKPAVQNGDPP